MRWTGTIVAVIAFFSATTGAIALSDPERRAAALCETATRNAERTERLPRGLLEAISLKEFGRWDGGAKRSVPWPWTVTSGGPGEHLASREEALAKVRDLQAKGVTNIDVGCMQINLRYHPHAFEDLEAAFDPAKNAAYAGAHLRQLREDHKSWNKAVERYHSSNPERCGAYRKAVYQLKYAATKARMVSARETATLTWKERQQAQRKAYAAAKKARLKVATNLRESKQAQKKRLRAAFEKRKAKVFKRWDEMMKKRREAANGKRS
jgi:hypothetical protein